MEVLDGINGPWWLGLPLALVVGFLLGASPFTWPVLALATGARAVTDEGPGTWRPDPAVAGIGLAIVVVYGGLGFFAERLDEVVRVGIGSWTGVVYAGIAVASLVAGGVLLARPALLCRSHAVPGSAGHRLRGHVGGFVVGLPVALANCPACAGIITGVALAAVATGSTAYAVAAMVALGVGHALALLVGSVLLLRPVAELFRVATAVQRAGAVLLLGVGVWYALQASRYGLAIAEPLP